MSTLDRQPRQGGGVNDCYSEPRVCPGGGERNPPRANQPPRLSPVPPKGPDLTGVRGLPRVKRG